MRSPYRDDQAGQTRESTRQERGTDSEDGVGTSHESESLLGFCVTDSTSSETNDRAGQR